MTEHRLRTPVEKEEILRMDAGDVVYISGTMVTARDEAHIRMIEYLERGEE